MASGWRAKLQVFFFCHWRREIFSKNCIQFLKDGDKIISKTNEILDTFSNALQTKYSVNKNVTPERQYVRRFVEAKLNTDEQSELDVDVSMSELTIALNSMKKGKTPGSNGFPVEFFRCFWLELGPFLLQAVKKSLYNGECLPSHQEGIITLIPKKGKPHYSIKGWRPITLLNTDYKIISTAISSRIRKAMGRLIDPAQTAYTAGRFIGENTRLLCDIIHWTKSQKSHGLSWQPTLRRPLNQLNGLI